MKKKAQSVPFQDVLKEQLKDPEFAFYYHRARMIRDIAHFVRDNRLEIGLTQVELAKRAATTQSVIARLESAKDKRMPSLDLLGRIARVFKSRLVIGFDREERR